MSEIHKQAEIAIDDLFLGSLTAELRKIFNSESGIRRYYLPQDEYLPYYQKRRDIFPHATVWRFSNKPFRKAGHTAVEPLIEE